MDKKVKMDWRRWASIARLSIRKMCCLNGSRKLLTQKIFIRPYCFYFPVMFAKWQRELARKTIVKMDGANIGIICGFSKK